MIYTKKASSGIFAFLLQLVLLASNSNGYAQKEIALPRSTPEAQGVASEDILAFLDAASKSKHEFHSFMLLRHGKVVAEGWWNPYRKDLVHTMYSVSKSFTATAVGFAVAEAKLAVTDKVTSFFPEYNTVATNPKIANLTIKDLLTMTVGNRPTDGFRRTASQQDWVKGFFNLRIYDDPGTVFAYNSGGSHILSAIVQKVTGQKIIDYLTPRLFEPLGIRGIDWEQDPQGINTGGWGLRLKTEDMAKFGQLFLQKGVWNGRQIIPRSWVEAASSKQVDQKPNATQAEKDASIWLQGYGYQMWRGPHQSYRADGAYGQYIIMLPEKDAVIIATCHTSDMQGEFDLLTRYLVPALRDKKLPTNKKANELLREKTAKLALPLPAAGTSDVQNLVSGKTYTMITERKFSEMAITFKDQLCQLMLKTDSATHELFFGGARWEIRETTKYGPYLIPQAASNRAGLPPFRVAGSYSWVDNKTLELTLRYIDTPHTETIRCTFADDKVSVDFIDFLNVDKTRKVHSGIVRQDVQNPPRLIVRGDDMGFSHSANLAMVQCYKEGIETSIEVIVPSPWFPEAVKMLERNPSVDVGLHFAITAEWDNVKWRPLTNVPSLTHADGYFFPMIYPNKNYPNGAVLDHQWKTADIERELRAQIEMIKKHIPRVSHISGHMNSTGFTPEVRELCTRVGAEYGLKMVDIDPAKNFGFSYVGFPFAHKNTAERIDAFIEMLDKLEPGKTYVYVEHPAFDDPEMRAIYHIGYEDVASGRQDVTTIFTSEKVKEAVVRKGIRLVSYKEIL